MGEIESQIPDKVIELVERFDNNNQSYKCHTYNETQVRREFLDPFFKALGWDIDNEQGYAEAYKDVVHEDALKVGRATEFLITASASAECANFFWKPKSRREI